jgi:hypothetical protein
MFGTAGLAGSKCIDLVDAVYFDIANVSCWNVQSSQSPSANSIIGVNVRSCMSNPIPNIGYGRISNFIAYSPESALGGFNGSRGILIDGSGGGAGGLDGGVACTASNVMEVAIDGFGDIENFQRGIEFNSASNSSVSGAYLIGGGDQGVKFTSAQYNTISNARFGYETNYSTDGGCAAGAGVGCAVWVDSNSYDNLVEHPVFLETISKVGPRLCNG